MPYRQEGVIDLQELTAVCGRDVRICINGSPFLQAEKAEIRQSVRLHPIRSCFCNEDMAVVKTASGYKAVLTNLCFLRPFENCNFHDLDNFTVTLQWDDQQISLLHCFWNEFALTADKERFRESITLTALQMEVATLDNE